MGHSPGLGIQKSMRSKSRAPFARQVTAFVSTLKAQTQRLVSASQALMIRWAFAATTFPWIFKVQALINVVATLSGFVTSIAIAATTTTAPVATLPASTASATSNTALRLNLESPAKKTVGLLEAGWDMSLSGESFANEKEQAQIAGLELGGKVRYGLLPSLEMKADAGVALESGYAQSRFGDNTPKNGLDLHEAIVQYKPISRVTLQAGAINQAQLNSPLIVGAQPFPGALEKVLLGTKDLNFELKAEQTVPTSSTLSTKAVEAEQTPSFMAESLTARAKLLNRMSVSVFGMHYAFHSLPSTVAQESELYGNTITPTTSTQDQFTYQFDGYSYGGGTKVLLSREVAWTLDGQVVTNTKAPESYNQGQLASSGFEIGLPGDIDLKPRAEVFFAESDVTPGFYNGSDRGHNNRTGWAADLSATFKKAGFLIGGRFAQADLINPSTVQTRQSYIMLRFETLYAYF